MNMKKKIGVFATLFAAVLCALPQSAQAQGKIRSIEIRSSSDNGKTYKFPNYDDPLRVGDKISIIFHLANYGWTVTETTNPGDAIAYQWYFKYPGGDSSTARKPQVGLWIGGRVREAEYATSSLSDWTAEGALNGRHYTDLEFTYTVRAGDIALPIQLANVAGDGPADSSGYYFKWNDWQLTNMKGDVCTEFAFGPEKLTADTDFLPIDGANYAANWRSEFDIFGTEDGQPRATLDIDLSEAGVYVRTIDFDDEYSDTSTDPQIWRKIHQDSNISDKKPAVKVSGSGSTPNTVELYVWAENPDIAVIEKGSENKGVVATNAYTFKDGVTRVVGTFILTAGDSSVPFNVRALGAEGGTTKLFLASTCTNVYNASGHLITNFTERTIKIDKPLPPFISVKVEDISGTVEDKDKGENNEWVRETATSDHVAAKVKVNVELSQVWTDDIDVPIKVTMKKGSTPVEAGNDYIGLSDSSVNDNTEWKTLLHVDAGDATAAMSLYMYVNRGTTNTIDGLVFEVDTSDPRWTASASSFFNGTFTSATVYIEPSAPVVTGPDFTAQRMVEAGSNWKCTLSVVDAFGERDGPYTVKWVYDNPPSGDPLEPDSDYATIATTVSRRDYEKGATVTFEVPVPLSKLAGVYTNYFRVVNQDNGVSSPLNMVVWNVREPLSKGMTCTRLKSKFAENTYVEQDVVSISFSNGFSMPDRYGQDEGYLFLIPLNESSSNLVWCVDTDLNDDRDWKGGIEITQKSPTEPPMVIPMVLLDGNASTAGTKMKFQAVVRTKPSLDEGQVVTEWGTAHTFEFSVTNVAPIAYSVTMGAETLKENGGQMKNHVSLNATKTLSASAGPKGQGEPSEWDLHADEDDAHADPADYYTDPTKAFTTRWTYTYDDGYTETDADGGIKYGIPSKSFNHKFTHAGVCTVTVEMRDKDMYDRVGNEWTEENVFTFTVVVDAKPAISLSPRYGSTVFTEADGVAGETSPSRINVNLTAKPSEEIAVQLLIRRVGTDDGNYPMPELSTTTLTFGGDSPNTTNAYFTLRNLDGTDKTLDPGFVIYAAVTNENRNSDNVPWKEVYRDTSLPISIVNLAPEITRPISNTVTRAINEPFTINYTFKDFGSYDMYNNGVKGETLYWTITGEPSSSYVITPPPNMNTYRGEFTTMFTSAGTKTIQLQVVDKDGGESEVAVWYYKVDAAKQLLVTPCGPGESSGGNFAVKWTGQRNLGVGYVWADGAIKPFSDFTHMYTYAPSTASAIAYAHGYSAGTVDTGLTTPGKGYAVTQNGSYPATGNYYRADAVKDSFFYAWLLSAGEEGGSGLVTTLMKLAPTYGADSNSKQIAPLPKEEKDATYYPDTILDAIFSKEFLVSDNLGDLNGDQIPDIYAVNPIWDGGKRLFEIAGYNSEDGGDVAFKASSYNDDGDYLPSRSFQGGLPSTADGWSTLGEPFTAYKEIRGEHEGLNHRKEHALGNDKNLYVRGEWVSVPHFSEAETNAVAYWNAKRNGSPTPDLVTWTEFKAAATNEATYATEFAEWSSKFETAVKDPNSWIPEKRTDPTLWDTDDDGLPDGYEYYFWYRAAVGTINDGKWVQLTGEKFTLNNITKGDKISPEDIMKAFDPTVRASGDIATRDTDNDGLTDLEEFAMGTNPVHWDSDGDGMSDLWEVMRGLNPLKVPSNPEQNPDGDFMASYHTPGSYAIVTLNNGKVYALEQNGTNLKTFEAESFDGDGGKTKGGTNVLASVVFGVEDVSNVTAIAVFHYGNDSSACVPKKRGNPNAQEKPLDPDEVSLADTEVVSVQLRQSLMLIHDQVYNQHEFHPYTAWNINANGDVSARWGAAVNTVPYNCVDEYRVMKYRYEVGIANRDNNRALADIFLDLTTNPNTPFTDAAYTVSWAGTDGGGTEQVASVASIPTYRSDNHGADTDEDGIPDGWELYVGANPNDATDASGDGDRDGLSLRNEYAGSDSCDAYQNAANAEGTATIYQYHPGNAKGWFNKFTPTDPKDGDTDKDGVSDSGEGGVFIYGDPTDDGSTCIRGGGLNPCGVDTDFDLLPDGWERQYQGTVVPAGTGFENIHPDIVQIIKRNDNLGSNAVIRAYISFGMDGTYNDAFKVPTANQVDPRTGTRRNLDFDNDGLLNFQEYLVQVLRHLRYDDTETPLMGSYLPDGIAGTRKYIGFLPMHVWDGATFFKTARAAGFTGLSARQGDGFKFRELGYFAPPEKTWDLTMSGSRILKPPRGLSDIATADDESRMGASRYVGTDPRDWDTDRDGMDDYYELFHGLNPLLGSKDIISEAYNTVLSNDKLFSARCTAWSNWEEKELVYDAMRFPWAMGVAEADADGDGLRNTDEALLVNMPNPKNYHTDPTPLWMTDSSSKISVTAQYYCRDPYASGEGDDIPALSTFPWFTYVDGRDPGSVNKYMFTFEENEGYDTDHDWIPDEQELTHAVTGASSPLHSSDPDRRQAMYFPGEESVVQSYSGNLHRRIGENYAMLRAFSVEAWVRPEDLTREQTIVTRVCNYPSSTLSNATHQVRANFRIKMDDNGRVWGQYDSDDAVQNGSPKGFGTATVEGNTLESNKWSHVALTFDGNSLILYINGREVNRYYSNLIPANGLVVTLQEVNPNGSNYGVDGYDTYPSALLIGADAKELGALDIGPESSWTNYCAHYKGWVDEVRVWDGARTQAEIQADMLKRYTLNDVSDLRAAVYKEWLNGGTHNPNDGRPNLPTELVFHYGFQQLPSEIEADYVASEPSGFTERVLDNVKWNGRSVDIRCGWWNAVPIASTVYGNRAIVPWVRDTCAMLPMLDGSSYDSRYWSELIGGVTFPTEVNVQTFQFPNVANPYPYWNYMAETFFREQRLNWMRGSVGAGLSDAADDVYNRLRFGNRTLFVGGSDLLPLGGAFAKRCPDFWDGQGSTDAWTATVDDTDNDGLPDWWEAHAAAEYGADAATLTTKTKISYKLPSGSVVEMSAWEAYQIDLARGIIPGVPATYDPAFESLADNNNDGLPDWWQKLYDVYDLDPDEDPDNDGLSIYQEWKISWDEENGFGVLNGYPFLSPTKARSGDAQEVTDYFLKSTTAPYEGYYLGEIVADIDMMEDGFEDLFGTDDTVFDAWSDYDEDSWTAWSELRYSTFKMSKAGQFVSHYVGDTEVVDSPEPVIHATLRYNGEIPAGSTNTTFIVQAFAGNNMLKAPTATYVVKPGTTETRYYYLGMQEDRVLHGTFTPGFVQTQKGSLALQFAFIQPADTYAWRVTTDNGVREYSGTYAELREAIVRYGNSLEVAALSFQWSDVNGGVSATDGTRNALTMAIDSNTQKGHLLVDMEIVGDIDCTTGDFTFDLSKIAGHTFTDSAIPSSQCFYRIVYNVKLPTMQNKKLALSLGKPTRGALVEGPTAFAAFIDLNGNGTFTADSEPFGFVKNVEVGWDNVPELVIELTDTSAAAGKRLAYTAGSDATNVVRIIRTAINGKESLDNGQSVKRRIVYNRDMTSTDRKSIHEGDLVTAGRFGLDWANLRSDVEALDGLDLKSVISVTYTVVTNAGSVININSNDVVDVFTVSFPAEQSKPTAVAPSPLTGPKVETQRPTFKWTGTEDNTAFILQILNTDDTPVYTSPLQVLPPRDSSGAYVWTAPVYIGTNVCADAWSLDNNTNYSWRVAMFSPKFSNTNLETAVWSDAAAFETRLAEGGTRTTAYGAADVKVRYFGPATNDLSSVVVQLYKTADFTGDPAAQSRLFDVDGQVELLTNNTYVVRFLGLEEGTYYALAYIDRNGDCVRQRSESWGYANQVGTGVEEIYTPVEVKIVSKSGTVPSAEIFMEDADVNQNDIPDCLDDESILTVASATAGADTTDVDGDGLTVDDETGDTYTDPSLWDSDGDGMPDGWEAMFAGTDPLSADANTEIAGDVMAYAEETWKLVTDAAGSTYLVNPTNDTVHVGDDLPLSRLVATYDYPVDVNGEVVYHYGMGTNLLDEVTLFRVAKVENVTVVLVHAQVYAAYGFDQLTANTTAYLAGGAVNTKEFTALDKYLLIRYFEALGLCTEADVNTNRKWADFSLKPNDPDNDRDGVYDGWELYVMFGPDVVTDTLADARISPFNYDDARTVAPAAGSALTVLEEFDDGNSPTDPWNVKSLPLDGISDKDAYDYSLKTAEDQLADDDNDGLSNWAEYLASKLTGKKFDVANPTTFDNRLDYFYQITQDGVTKYIGECIDAGNLGLVADHDFMEDWWEDKYDVTPVPGWSATPWPAPHRDTNRYVYDPYADRDGDGWSNWSEARSANWRGYFYDDLVDSWVASGEDYNLKSYPTPTIKVFPTYYGLHQPLVGKSLVVRAHRKGNPQDVVKYVAIGAEAGGSGGGASSTSGNGTAVSSIIGVYDKPIVMHGHLHPGRLLPDSGAKFETRSFTVETYYTWHCTRCGLTTRTTSYDEYNQHKQRHGEATEGGGVGVVLERVTSEPMEQFARTICGPDGRTGDIVTMTNNVVVGRVNFITGEYTIDLAKVLSAGYELEGKFFRATWDYRVGREWPQSFCLSVPSEGRLKEGLNTFEVFIDKDGNGEYDAGEPYGFVRDVNVGWDSVPEIVVELRDESPVGERFNIGAQGDISTRVRVVRTAINGQTLKRRRTVYAKTLDLRAGKLFTEADLIGDEEFDFDWSRLTDDAAKFLGIMTNDIRTVDYTVYAGTNIVTTFTRLFDVTNSAPTASGASATHTHTVATAQPTLWWQASAGYPAFALQIAKDEAFSEIVYATTNLMPGATSEGCLFKPEIYVGDGLEDATTYYWRVQQLNAKFTTNKWSKVANFRTAVNSTNADTGYGRVGVDVRYYGPAEAALSDVVVGVYESADFASMPVARKRLSGDGNVSTLVNDANKPFSVVSTNIVLDGIAPGNYYVMAFIDKNGNGRRDYWESWGYVNKITTDDADIYTPATFTVSSAKVDVPTGILVIEDTDVNQNWTPDCLEDDDLQEWKLPSEIEPDEPSADDIDSDCDGLTDTDEDDYGTDPLKPDTDGDGIPDGYEIDHGTDPLFADADVAGMNDVMAYKLDSLKVMVTTNDTGEVTGRYAVNSRFENGYEQQSNTVYTVFEVNGQLYVGAPTNRQDVMNTYAYGYVTNVVVMHSAVYDFYGYDPTTAKPGTVQTVAGEDGAETSQTVQGANTVPFTALLKYVTQEYYLKEFGDATNDFALAINKLDSNANYLPDGYELYVRYAVWHDPALTYDDADARSSYGDNIAQLPYDPYDNYFFYNYLKKQNAELAATLPPFDNATAFDLGVVGAGGFAGADKDWWDWAPEDDYMAYVQTNVLISVVTNTDGVASIYAIDPGTNTLYETFYVGNELFVGAVCTNDYAYDAMENGDFMTMVTNATVIHSAVYDWYGFDPTTAKPSYWWPESIAYLAESNSNYTVGANSAPFSRRMKLITQMMYLPMVGAEDDYDLTTWWTDTNGNDMPDGWELYVKYAASSDPGKTDDDYKDDFTGGSDPNSDDTDGDGIPDDVEQFFGVTDPTVPDGNLAIENDVMAFATVNATVVTVQNTAEGSLPMKYLLAEEMAGNTVTAPKVGDYADSLALRATYDYLVPSGANDGSVTNRCGVGTNVTLTAAAGTANRIVAVAKEPVVLVHAQVYDYFGFNKDTANPTAVTMEGTNYVYGANTKAFTALDKYLVVRYFEAYGLADAKTDWKALALAPSSSDNDIDGVPDGWELYTMFGTEGLTATIAAAKISPYNYDDARALAPAGDITLLEKWNGGAPAYDPWSKDSNGNGVDDVDEIKYVLDEPYSDADNDQLPNFTEFLIGSGFSQYSEFAGVSDISATNTYSLTNLIPDYFRRINNKLYLGEMFTDHDFMEDLWEDLFDVTKITRGLYDPWRDSDSDGWSNYAECRAGTNPELEANTYGLKGIVVKNYPVPTIHAKVVMGPGEGMLNGTIVVQAFSDTSKLTGLPDAIWTIPVGASSEESTSGTSSSGSSSSDSSNNSAKTKYLGAIPNGEVAFTLSPGFVKPGSISMSFLDPDFEIIDTNGVVTALGDINTAEWQTLVSDRQVTGTLTGKILASTPTNSLEIGTIDYHTGLMTVDYTKLPAAWPVVGEDNDATNSVLLHLANSYVNVSWEAEVVGGNPWMALHLTDSDDTTSESEQTKATLGHVREGKNTFVVFVAGEDGKWAPGNAYGVVQDVDVGWSEAEFTIELTKTTPIMARFDLPTAFGGGGTDRDMVNALTGYYRNEESDYPGTNMPTTASLTRVRIVRNWINEVHARNDVLFDKRIDLSVHPTLTEYDLLADGKLDLDWGTLNRAFNGSATASASLESATYRVVIGEDNDGGYTDVGEYENYGNNLPTLFSNRYEARTSQTPTVPDPKLAQIVYPSRPTFRWSHTNSIDKAYPAFRLRIYADAGKNTTVYDSGPQRAPARDSNGMYEWTAPVYAGMVTPAGRVLTTTNNYYWAVSMLDAKFTGFSNDEKTTPFRLGMSGNLLDGKEYGSIAVRVKYFGPLVGKLSVVPTTRKNLVRVQAFTSPDFSGLPVAETYVTGVSTIASASVIETNAVIRGVAVNGTYYVRAYIDTDADGVKSDWESWGYNCFVLDPTVASVWRPKPVTVSYQDMMPDATVFIEDADTENDGFPDAWEWNENGNLSSQGPISGNTFFATVNPYLNSTLNAYTKIAGGLEGATGATGNMRSNRLQASISASAQMLADAAETTAVQIKAFSLEGGLELEVVNTTSGGDSSSMITFNNEATVQLSLMCATTPDFADAVEVPIKSITIYANKTTDGDGVAVTAEELANARAKAPEARFFKAILTK